MSDRRVLRAVSALACAGLFATLWVGRRMWLGDEVFGDLPAWPGAPLPPATLGSLHFGWLLAGLVPVWLRPHEPGWAVAWLALFLVRVVPDRLLWQPYLYLFAWLLAFAALGLRTRGPQGAALDACRWALAGAYLWSGLHKLNPVFLDEGAAWLLGPFGVDEGWPLAAIGRAAAATEIGLGAALLVPALWRPACLGLVGMHALILAALGPAGRDYNPVIWPWNAAMVLLLCVLFAAAAERRPLLRLRHALVVVAALVFVALPALDLGRLWPGYLSFRLYSLNEDEAFLLAPGSLLANEAPDAQALSRPLRGRPLRAVPLVAWSERRLGGVLPNEPHVAALVVGRLCRRWPDAGIRLLVSPRASFDEPHPGLRERDCDALP